MTSKEYIIMKYTSNMLTSSQRITEFDTTNHKTILMPSVINHRTISKPEMTPYRLNALVAHEY